MLRALPKGAKPLVFEPDQIREGIVISVVPNLLDGGNPGLGATGLKGDRRKQEARDGEEGT